MTAWRFNLKMNLLNIVPSLKGLNMNTLEKLLTLVPNFSQASALAFGILASIFFSIGFLALKGALFPNIIPFKWFYAALLGEFGRAPFIGVTFSALGMVFAGIAFAHDPAVTAPTLAVGGLIGNVVVIKFLDHSPWTLEIYSILLIMCLMAFLLINTTSSEGSEVRPEPNVTDIIPKEKNINF